MKKFTVFMTVFILGTVSLFAQAISFKLPNAFSSYSTGQTIKIGWINNTNANPRSVNIVLFGTGKTGGVATIVEYTDNDGQYNWVVPPHIKGGRYTIKIRNMAKTTTLGESAAFAIRQIAPPGAKPPTNVKLKTNIPTDPCQYTQNESTDLVLESLTVVSVMPSTASINVTIKNDGKRCIKNCRLIIKTGGIIVERVLIEPGYFNDGRTWLMTGHQKIVWTGSVDRPRSNPKTTHLSVDVDPIPEYDAKLNATRTNDIKGATIVWEK